MSVRESFLTTPLSGLTGNQQKLVQEAYELFQAAHRFVTLAEETPYDWPNTVSREAYEAYKELRELLGIPDGAEA